MHSMVYSNAPNGFKHAMFDEAAAIGVRNIRVDLALTQVVVDADDPAFDHPAKPVGPMYTHADAERLAAERGWSIAADAEGWRRVVPSPQPRSIVEIDTISLLVRHGVTVICAGGGGIPVMSVGMHGLRGVEAVIDKDAAACLLAQELQADGLVLLTDVPGVYRGWGTPFRDLIGPTTPAELRKLEFPAGSMGPKVDAACRFAEATGKTAAIGALADIPGIVAGTKGTLISGAHKGLEWHK